MSNLSILKTSIRTYENLYSLNDLHIASGGEAKHRPNQFVRIDTTKELISEIQRQEPTAQPLKTLRGTQGGTYACEELVLAYAMWISPKFHLVVLRAFLAMHKGKAQNVAQIAPAVELQHTLTLTDSELKTLCWLWKMAELMRKLLSAVQKPLALLGSTLAPAATGYANEYRFNIEAARKILARETQHIELDNLNRNGWNGILQALRRGTTNTNF